MIYVLEEIFKSKKNQNSDAFNLRVQRGLSWLKKAVLMENDLDLQFLSLWVSVNAIHAEDHEPVNRAHRLFEFIEKLLQQDREQKISQLIWNQLSLPTQQLLENPYAFQDFWEYKNQKISQLTWKANFAVEQARFLKVWKSKDTHAIVQMLFERMLTLRHQILQGGSSYNSAMNRPVLRQCCQILLTLLPVFIEVFIEHAQQLDLSKPFYPTVQMS